MGHRRGGSDPHPHRGSRSPSPVLAHSRVGDKERKGEAHAVDQAAHKPRQDRSPHLRLQEPNRDALVLYARFIGDTADYVLNQIIDSTIAKDRDFVAWRAEHPNETVTRPDGVDRSTGGSASGERIRGEADRAACPRQYRFVISLGAGRDRGRRRAARVAVPIEHPLLELIEAHRPMIYAGLLYGYAVRVVYARPSCLINVVTDHSRTSLLARAERYVKWFPAAISRPEDRSELFLILGGQHRRPNPVSGPRRLTNVPRATCSRRRRSSGSGTGKTSSAVQRSSTRRQGVTSSIYLDARVSSWIRSRPDVMMSLTCSVPWSVAICFRALRGRDHGQRRWTRLSGARRRLDEAKELHTRRRI